MVTVYYPSWLLDSWLTDGMKLSEHQVTCWHLMFSFASRCAYDNIIIFNLYKHFIFWGNILLSTYWREACTKYNDKKTGNIWNKEAFASMIKEYRIKSFPANMLLPQGMSFAAICKGPSKSQTKWPWWISKHASRFSSSCMMTSRLIMSWKLEIRDDT